MAEPELWDEFSERLRDLETAELAPEIISPFLALTGLRGFWPMSAFQSNGDCFDQSGNGRLLSYNGNPLYNYTGLAPFVALDGTGDYLLRADEAGLDILGTETFVAPLTRGLSMGGWFYVRETGTLERLIGKWTAAAGNRSYILNFTAADTLAFRISDDGTNTDVAASAVVTVFDAWYFVVGRFDPGATVSVVVNDVEVEAATARAAVFNGNANFVIGANSGGGEEFRGRASLCFLCAALLDDDTVDSLFQQTRAAFGI